jgi:hypothetical protein
VEALILCLVSSQRRRLDPRVPDWIESLIHMRSHLNRPIYPPEDKFFLVSNFDSKGEYAMLMIIWA